MLSHEETTVSNGSDPFAKVRFTAWFSTSCSTLDLWTEWSTSNDEFQESGISNKQNVTVKNVKGNDDATDDEEINCLFNEIDLLLKLNYSCGSPSVQLKNRS